MVHSPLGFQKLNLPHTSSPVLLLELLDVGLVTCAGTLNAAVQVQLNSFSVDHVIDEALEHRERPRWG